MDIPNIQPPPPAASAQLDLSVQNHVVQQQLERIPVGVTLVGAVAGNDKNGNLIIRLAGNDLILSSPLALNKGAQVALQIQNVSGSFVATLLSVDGKLPATQPQAVSNQLLQNPNNLLKEFIDNSANARIVSVLNPGAGKVAQQTNTEQPPITAKTDIVSLTSPQTSSLKAIVVTATPEIVQNLKTAILSNEKKSGNSELLNSLPKEITPGSQLNLKITSVQTQQQNQDGEIQTGNNVIAKPEELNKPAKVTPEQITQNTNLKTAETPQNPPAEKSPLTSNAKQMATNLQLLVENFAASFKALPNGNILLNAIIIDKKPDGELLVETRFGKMIIDAGKQFAHLEKGAIIDLELTSIATAPANTIKLPEKELPLQQLDKSWPALKELAEHVKEQDPKTLPPELKTTNILDKVAGVEHNFAARMAAFLNAVKTGNLRDWLGANNYDAMDDDSTGTQILGKLKHDMSVMKDLMAERTPVNWQTMLFPVFDGKELHQARLHVKYLPDENNQPDKKTGTRFIVELDTSHFGEIQMDGLVHNNVSSKYFDMIIRTHQPLEENMEKDIRQIFSDAGQITGFKGDIEFATMKEFPLTIMDTIIERKLSSQIDHKGIEA